MEILKLITLFLISPLNIATTLLVIGLFAAFRKRHFLARYLHVSAFVVLLVFSQPYTAVLLLYPLEYGSSYNEEHILLNYTPDYIYAPACYYSTTGNKTEVSNFHTCSMQRLIQVARVSRLKPNAQIIVTGGNFLFDKDIFFADKAKELLVSLGIPAERISAVNQGTTTLSEVESIKTLITNKSILAISTATHGKRLTEMLSLHANQVYFYPVDFLSNGELTPFVELPSATALESSRRALYEYGARLKFYLVNQ